MRKISPQEQHQALSHRIQTCFITLAALHIQPLRTNPTKPPVPLTLKTLPALLLILTHIPMTKFFPTPTHLLRAPPTQTPSNSHHQDTISAGSTLL